MKRLLILILFVALIALVAVNLKPGGGSALNYRVARDPTWYPLELKGRAKNILAFSDELVKAIADEEQLRVEVVNAPWDTHSTLLERGLAEGVLTPVTPSDRLRESFLFSEPYLRLGPVLVVRRESSIQSIKDMHGKALGVDPFQGMNFPIPPDVTFTPTLFEDATEAIQLLIKGDLDGVVLNYMDAQIIVNRYYKASLRIATEPLNNLGLRLMVRKPQGQDLLDAFNRGLEDLKQQGVVDVLIQKWSVL